MEIETLGEACKVWESLELKLPESPLDDCIFPNANKLLEIKNNLYIGVVLVHYDGVVDGCYPFVDLEHAKDCYGKQRGLVKEYYGLSDADAREYLFGREDCLEFSHHQVEVIWFTKNKTK